MGTFYREHPVSLLFHFRLFNCFPYLPAFFQAPKHHSRPPKPLLMPSLLPPRPSQFPQASITLFQRPPRNLKPFPPPHYLASRLFNSQPL